MTKRTKTETVKDWVQILAILVGAIWAYYKFGRIEAPSLEYRASTTGSLQFSPYSEVDGCFASFEISIKNIGKSTFKIDSVKIEGWAFDITNNDSISPINFDLVRRNPTMIKINENKKDSPFLGEYPPGASYLQNYWWIVKGLSKRYLYVRAEFKTDKENVSWHVARWGELCKME